MPEGCWGGVGCAEAGLRPLKTTTSSSSELEFESEGEGEGEALRISMLAIASAGPGDWGEADALFFWRSFSGMVPSRWPALTNSTLRKRSFLSEEKAPLRWFAAQSASSLREKRPPGGGISGRNGWRSWCACLGHLLRHIYQDHWKVHGAGGGAACWLCPCCPCCPCSSLGIPSPRVCGPWCCCRNIRRRKE